MYFYKFSPFSLVGKILSKAFREKIRVIIIIPNGLYQHWYSRILYHSGTGDQTTGIKPSSDTQTIGSASSEQAIRAIGYQGNNETTVKMLNASLELNIVYILDSGNLL